MDEKREREIEQSSAQVALGQAAVLYAFDHGASVKACASVYKMTEQEVEELLRLAMSNLTDSLRRERERGDKVRETMLLNAHQRLAKKYKGVPLWSFVSDITAFGSTSSIEICRAHGWNPHQDGAAKLERVAARAALEDEQ